MLAPAGRIAPKPFWAGFAGLIIFFIGMNFLMKQLTSGGALEFWMGLIYFFLVFQIMYSIYGKRLHDMGRTFWPLTTCITATILISIGVMMSFGGAEYFSEFAQYDRKDIIDPARRDEITKTYESRLANGERILAPILSLLWVGFTLWVGFGKRDPKTNIYGPKV